MPECAHIYPPNTSPCLPHFATSHPEEPKDPSTVISTHSPHFATNPHIVQNYDAPSSHTTNIRHSGKPKPRMLTRQVRFSTALVEEISCAGLRIGHFYCIQTRFTHFIHSPFFAWPPLSLSLVIAMSNINMQHHIPFGRNVHVSNFLLPGLGEACNSHCSPPHFVSVSTPSLLKLQALCLL